MNKLVLLALSMTMAFTLKCAAETTPKLPRDVTSLVQGNTAFALDLFQKLKKTDENLFFSPYSISLALAMTYAGAEGNTQKEMQKTLHFPAEIKDICEGFRQIEQFLNTNHSSGHQTVLKNANSLWLQQGAALLPAYQQIIDHCFQGHFKTVNFLKHIERAENEINQWVADQTADKILNIIQSNDLDPDTRLVLVSAIYLKAQWKTLFSENETHEAPFYQSPKNSYPIQMMSLVDWFRYYKGASFAVLELPYAAESKDDPKLSMVILLPDQAAAIGELEAQLTPEHMHEWISKLQPRRMHVNLPKFKLRERLNLKEILESMGMANPFSTSADFSGMNGDKTLRIGAVNHQSYLSVDENGTEAAAATALSMSLKAVFDSEEPTLFKADHPFLLLIMEKETQTILFIGKINKIS